MLSQDNRLKDRRDFGVVHERGRRWHDRWLALNALPREKGSPSRFGFVVSRKIGTAVIRNRIKRQLRAIIRAHLAGIERGHDVVIVARQPAAGASYATLESSLLGLLRQARLRASLPEVS